MNIRKMTAADEPVIVPMVYKFYESDAVDHPVPRENLRRTFHAAVEDGSLLDGYVLEDEDGVAGFAYLSAYYACEVGGVNMMLEEIYLRPEARGKGYGTKFLKWMERQFPEVRRFRLEVTESNGSAARLYEQQGYHFLGYRQMVKDV